jgi:hypothetical protein
MRSRDRIISQYESAMRARRRTEGWISGYSIRTKRHDARGGVGGGGKRRTARDERIEEDGGGDGRVEGRGEDAFDSMCTICLLEVDDGDIVADLSCGHVFHPDCLGEWILKKVRVCVCVSRDCYSLAARDWDIFVRYLPSPRISHIQKLKIVSRPVPFSRARAFQNSCPLCQDRDIAKEIRCYEADDDLTNNVETSTENDFFCRWRREARERFVDVATGRSRRGRRTLGNR